MKKYKKSQPGFEPWTPATIFFYKYFDIGPPEPDNKNPHKAVHLKIPNEGTNLPNQ
jgi:hypothetical protein